MNKTKILRCSDEDLEETIMKYSEKGYSVISCQPILKSFTLEPCTEAYYAHPLEESEMLRNISCFLDDGFQTSDIEYEYVVIIQKKISSEDARALKDFANDASQY